MATAMEKKIEKIFQELYEGYEKGNNWMDAMKKVNSVIKNIQEESERKLKHDRRTLIYEIDINKKNVKTLQKELNTYKKFKIPSLQREIIRLNDINKKLNDNGSNRSN